MLPVVFRYLPHQSVNLLGLIKDISQVTFPTVLTIVHSSHEDASSAFLGRALSSQSLDLSISINLVVFEHCQLGLLTLVLDLLWGGVDLLLAFLGTAAKSEDEVKSRLLLDVVVGQGAPVFELLAGKDQTLLVGRNSFLVLTRDVSHGWQNLRGELRTYLESCS